MHDRVILVLIISHEYKEPMPCTLRVNVAAALTGAARNFAIAISGCAKGGLAPKWVP